MIEAKCTAVRCPMQYGYKVDECNHTDCPYRTEPITNADHIRNMTDEELVELLHTQIGCGLEYLPCGKICDGKCNSFTDEDCKAKILDWLKQPYDEACKVVGWWPVPED